MANFLIGGAMGTPKTRRASLGALMVAQDKEDQRAYEATRQFEYSKELVDYERNQDSFNQTASALGVALADEDYERGADLFNSFTNGSVQASKFKKQTGRGGDYRIRYDAATNAYNIYDSDGILRTRADGTPASITPEGLLSTIGGFTGLESVRRANYRDSVQGLHAALGSSQQVQQQQVQQQQVQQQQVQQQQVQQQQVPAVTDAFSGGTNNPPMEYETQGSANVQLGEGSSWFLPPVLAAAGAVAFRNARPQAGLPAAQERLPAPQSKALSVIPRTELAAIETAMDREGKKSALLRLGGPTPPPSPKESSLIRQIGRSIKGSPTIRAAKEAVLKFLATPAGAAVTKGLSLASKVSGAVGAISMFSSSEFAGGELSGAEKEQAPMFGVRLGASPSAVAPPADATAVAVAPADDTAAVAAPLSALGTINSDEYTAPGYGAQTAERNRRKLRRIAEGLESLWTTKRVLSPVAGLSVNNNGPVSVASASIKSHPTEVENLIKNSFTAIGDAIRIDPSIGVSMLEETRQRMQRAVDQYNSSADGMDTRSVSNAELARAGANIQGMERGINQITTKIKQLKDAAFAAGSGANNDTRAPPTTPMTTDADIKGVIRSTGRAASSPMEEQQFVNAVSALKDMGFAVSSEQLFSLYKTGDIRALELAKVEATLAKASATQKNGTGLSMAAIVKEKREQEKARLASIDKVTKELRDAANATATQNSGEYSNSVRDSNTKIWHSLSTSAYLDHPQATGRSVALVVAGMRTIQPYVNHEVSPDAGYVLSNMVTAGVLDRNDFDNDSKDEFSKKVTVLLDKTERAYSKFRRDYGDKVLRKLGIGRVEFSTLFTSGLKQRLATAASSGAGSNVIDVAMNEAYMALRQDIAGVIQRYNATHPNDQVSILRQKSLGKRH